MNEKVKNTSQGVNFDLLSSKELSSYDNSSPPRKVSSLRDVYDSCTSGLMTTEPMSYGEAQDKEEWINVMKEEIDVIERNETWELEREREREREPFYKGLCYGYNRLYPRNLIQPV